MTVKATYARAIPGESLRSRLPARARPLVDDRQFAGRVLDALIFPCTPGSVVTKRALEKALAKVEDRNNPLVIVGYDFTLEARAAVGTTEIILLSHHEYGWTDAGWSKIKRHNKSRIPPSDAAATSELGAEAMIVVRDFLLKRMAWDLSRPRFIESQREQILDRTQSDPTFAAKLREAALEALRSEEPSIIRCGLTALAFVGNHADLPLVSELKTHADPSVSKDAGTCLYELKRSLAI